MDRLTIDNKMINLGTETKVKFNVAMHGKDAGEIARYSRLSPAEKTLVRRRLSDNDESVEIVETKTKPKVSDGKASNNKKEVTNVSDK